MLYINYVYIHYIYTIYIYILYIYYIYTIYIYTIYIYTLYTYYIYICTHHLCCHHRNKGWTCNPFLHFGLKYFGSNTKSHKQTMAASESSGNLTFPQGEAPVVWASPWSASEKVQVQWKKTKRLNRAREVGAWTVFFFQFMPEITMVYGCLW